jgi:hypothetical protein
MLLTHVMHHASVMPVFLMDACLLRADIAVIVAYVLPAAKL